MSRASDYAATLRALSSSPTAFADLALSAIPPFCPEGCNWCARVSPEGKLILALPEIGGPGGGFRVLTAQEKAQLQAWILDVFDTPTPPIDTWRFDRRYDPRYAERV